MKIFQILVLIASAIAMTNSAAIPRSDEPVPEADSTMEPPHPMPTVIINPGKPPMPGPPPGPVHTSNDWDYCYQQAEYHYQECYRRRHDYDYCGKQRDWERSRCGGYGGGGGGYGGGY